VAQKDLDGLNECDAMLALIDDDDPGTIFEAGYATSMGIPIVGYGEQGNADGRKMLRGSGASLYTDLSTAVYQAVWAAAKHADERRRTGRRSG
jgi:nucleoside 2-deoxyribosyltransferase